MRRVALISDIHGNAVALYATVFPHLDPLASGAAVGRDRPRASLVRWIIEATVAGFRDPVCDVRCAQPAERKAQRR
jgi:hypothetical protein